ncbi:Hydroxyindole O-methyltransferase [Teratosphaeria destructans]|uniref:Hydroxyindole O-methyltransferase n=1 Tax=Teratosphaeria destructans TaxID=418781 RepID=A0A9W7W6M7_9PEZI|nr:Hydroxyindole O-methyltransferase [Teratosphaeria destructans]
MNGRVDSPSEGIPPTVTPLSHFAESIGQNLSILDDYYHGACQAPPSFQACSAADVLPKDAPLEVKEARASAMDQSLEVFEVLSGPTKVLSNLTIAYQTIAALRWLCHFNVLRLVPEQGSITFAELAQRANVSEAALKTVARMAMTAHLLHEPEPETLAHTAASKAIAESQPFHDWAVHIAKEAIHIAMSMVEATERWHDSTKTTETPFNIALDTELPFFEHLQKRPDHMKIYVGYQKAVASTEGLALQHIIRGYDWAALGRATVVDVGGSVGMASITLAEAFPDLNFIVQELPDGVRDGKEYIASVRKPESVTSRIQYQAHDFFQEQPIKGAEVYLLRMILHYWSLEHSVKTLRALIPALEAGKSRIIVMDTVLPAPGSISNVMERQLRVRDLAMMQLHGSHERNPEDWNAIFKAADERFEIKSMNMPFGSELAVIEVVLA